MKPQNLVAPLRQQIEAVLKALAVDPGEVERWPLSLIGAVVDSNRVWWRSSRGPREQLASPYRTPRVAGVNPLEAHRDLGIVRELALKTQDPSEAWEILASRGLILDAWVSSNRLQMVVKKRCSRCQGTGFERASDLCTLCGGATFLQTSAHRPPTMGCALALAVDAPILAMAEELAKEVGGPELGATPMVWNVIALEELRQSNNTTVRLPGSTENGDAALDALNAMGVLYAGLNHKLNAIELKLPALGEAESENPLINLGIPITPYDNGLGPTTCLSVAPRWDAPERVIVANDDDAESRASLMTRIRAWIRKMSD